MLPCVWDDADGQDGIPLVLMEAMALGIPVISSNISGIPELVEDKQTGLLTEPGNAQQLSARMLELISSRQLRSQLAGKARLKVEQEFDIVKNTDLLLKVFNGS